ncbi:hypothetical protein ES332_A11G267600v1 [Gossypium tomentosum]|uniref:Uncharacterized protein n=1 Tax=Gossypium tomentosum TaxID=34277 RepID=A0A5D2NGB8_GOSTO|nr:hypothetical protein ES332_A11G267600v1 [Gossypium tomentosum]
MQGGLRVWLLKSVNLTLMRLHEKIITHFTSNFPGVSSFSIYNRLQLKYNLWLLSDFCILPSFHAFSPPTRKIVVTWY